VPRDYPSGNHLKRRAATSPAATPHNAMIPRSAQATVAPLGSQATVKSHVNRVFAKAGVRDRAQAVAYAYRNGFVR
jgi:hypothetical protein